MAGTIEVGAAHRFDLQVLRFGDAKPFAFRSIASSMFSISISATPPELGGAIDTISKPAERAAHRRALLGLVLREVLFGDQPAVGRHVVGDAIGDPSLVERVGTIGRNRAQRLAEILEHEPIAAGPRAAARLAVGRDRGRKLAHRARRSAVESARQRRRNREAVFRQQHARASRRPSTAACRTSCAPSRGRERCRARRARDSPAWSARRRPCRRACTSSAWPSSGAFSR